MVLSKKALPSSVEVEGVLFPIHTDFRYFILLADMLNGDTKSIDATALDFMYVDSKPADRAAGVEALLSFMTPAKKLPRVTQGGASGPSVKCIDYNLDADLIYAAFMQQYNIDLFDIDELHWYKFCALLEGLQNCKLTDVIGFRLYEDNGEKSAYNKKQLELKKAWEIESDEERAEHDEALKAFNENIGG